MKRVLLAIALTFTALGASASAQTSVTTQATTTTAPQQAPQGRPTPVTTTPRPQQGALPAAVGEPEISVGSDYRGSVIDVWGVNTDPRGRGDVVVVVRGPPEPASVMRKRRVLGLWVNGDPVRFTGAPSFFAVLSTRPLRQIASPQDIWRLGLDPAASARLASTVPAGGDPSEYRTALVRLRARAGLYQVRFNSPHDPDAIDVTQRILFHARVELPANAPIDYYYVDTYVFREGHLINRERNVVQVNRIGAERAIHDLATHFSLLYGLLTVLLALGAGWLAAFTLRRG